jgi:hypothetical protein
MSEEEKKEECPSCEDTPKTSALPQASIIYLVESFFYQTMISLGKQMNPISKKFERDLEIAKFHIGIIEMLQEKTKGNLTPEEAEHINEILHTLRLAYLDEMKRI